MTVTVIAATAVAAILTAWVVGDVLLIRDRRRTRKAMAAAATERDRRVQAVIDAAEASRSTYVGDGAQR